MRPSERIIFLTLLERSDNADCAVPRYMSPSLAGLADMTGYTISATKEAITHLEKHGWLIRGRSPGGRGHKSAYQLDAGQPCTAPTPAACIRPPKQADGSAPFAQKQADGPTRKQADGHSQNSRSNPVSDVGLRRGRVKKDQGHWPASRLPGVRGNPIPADPETRAALRNLVDAGLGPVEIISITDNRSETSAATGQPRRRPGGQRR
jgi:hypothetical protein